MMYGIDISNHQAGLLLDNVNVGFAIIKATEGTGFVDSYCDAWVQQAKQLGIPWGFYHFARESNPETEARFFIDNTINYFGEGIPVLDWETTQTVDWVNAFVTYVHNETGVWPWIYGNPWRFNQGGVEQNCARWVAAYPGGTPNLNEPPYANGNVVAWQYTSTGRLSGGNGNLDMNVFYGDVDAWKAYARGDRQEDDMFGDDDRSKLNDVSFMLTRTDDITGRGMDMCMYDHVKWIAKQIKDNMTAIEAVGKKIDDLMGMIEKGI